MAWGRMACSWVQEATRNLNKSGSLRSCSVNMTVLSRNGSRLTSYNSKSHGVLAMMMASCLLGITLNPNTDVDGPYRLGQIRLGPNHGYRSLAMFLDKSSSAYWIYVYKKVRDRQPEDMERGRRIAQRLWNEIESNKER
jgi:hypothetical protein